MADGILPTTRDPPSKLAGLPFDAYKRAENKTVPASDPGQSMVSASPVDKRLPPKPRRVISGMIQFFFSIYILNLDEAPQTKRHRSTSKSKIPPDAEIIEISWIILLTYYG